MGWGDAFVWIAVGRLVEEKDYPTLLRAFRALRAHLVLDGNTGLLVAPRDPEALANAMHRSMKAPLAVRDAWRTAALAHVRANFAIGTVAERWIQLFHGLLPHERRP